MNRGPTGDPRTVYTGPTYYSGGTHALFRRDPRGTHALFRRDPRAIQVGPIWDTRAIQTGPTWAHGSIK